MTRFLRFSLGFCLLGITLACVSVSHYRLSLENRLLRQENYKLRKVGGFIDVKDPDKAYVMPIERAGPLAWRYRIYLPKDKEYYVAWEPTWMSEGFPKQVGRRYPIVGDGEQFIMTILLFEHEPGYRHDGGYGVSVQLPHSGGTSKSYRGSGTLAERLEWISDSLSYKANGLACNYPEEFEPDTRVDVMRHRAYTSQSLIPGPARGFMLWLVPTSVNVTN